MGRFTVANDLNLADLIFVFESSSHVTGTTNYGSFSVADEKYILHLTIFPRNGVASLYSDSNRMKRKNAPADKLIERLQERLGGQ